MKSHFERKQSKIDYSKLFEKNKNASTVLFGSEYCAFQWEKTIENHKSVGTGAHKVEKLVRFLPNFDLHFFNIPRAGKRYKIFIEIIGKYAKILKVLKVWK